MNRCAVAAFCLLVLAGCTSEPAPEFRGTTAGTTTDGDVTDVPCNASNADDFEVAGLAEAEARQRAAEQSREVRVTCVDGLALLVNLDLAPGRVNLHVADGVVVSSQIEQLPDYVEQLPNKG